MKITRILFLICCSGGLLWSLINKEFDAIPWIFCSAMWCFMCGDKE